MAAITEGAENVETEVRGFAVLTQTCDLVRPCADRPFVEVSPLVEVDDRVLREIERGRRPNYGFIPGVAPRRLVADLDRVMTVEKAVVAAWARVVQHHVLHVHFGRAPRGRALPTHHRERHRVLIVAVDIM